jgi:hypothetical protein
MAFEIEKLINDIINSKTLNAVFNNPIYSAIITVAVVLLLIYLTMRNEVDIKEDSNTSMMALMLTSGIYCILAVLGLVYLQHRAMTRDFEQKYSYRAADEVVAAVTEGQGEVTTLDVFNQRPVLQDINADESLLAEESQSESPRIKKKSNLSILDESSSSKSRKKVKFSKSSKPNKLANSKKDILGDDLTSDETSSKSKK